MRLGQPGDALCCGGPRAAGRGVSVGHPACRAGSGGGSGRVTAAIIALSTVGMSLQYSVTRTINFAHGELMTIGAYAAYVVARPRSNVLLQGAAAIAVGASLPGAFNRLLFRPFTRRPPSSLPLPDPTLFRSRHGSRGSSAIWRGA